MMAASSYTATACSSAWSKWQVWFPQGVLAGSCVHQVPEEKQHTAEHRGRRTQFGPPHVVLDQATEWPHQNPPAVLDVWVETMGSSPRPDTQLTAKSGQEKLPDFHVGKLPETPVVMPETYTFQSLFQNG